MEPITSVFRPTERAYADAVTAQTLIDLARKQGYSDFADNMANNIRSIRANASPQTARRDAQMLMAAFKEVDEFAKTYVQPNLKQQQQPEGYGPLELDEATGRLFQRSLANPESRKYQAVQTGYEIEALPGGGTRVKQVEIGGKKPLQDQAKVEDIDLTEAASLVQTFDDVLKSTGNLPQGVGVGGAIARTVLGAIPGTSATDFSVSMGGLEGQALLDTMMRLKQASSSGATGFGNFTEKEGERVIQSVLGGIDLKVSDPKIIEERLNRAKIKLLDLNFGSKAYRAKLLAEGKITGAMFDQIESLYSGSYKSVAGGQTNQPTGIGQQPQTTPSLDETQQALEKARALLQGQ